MAPNTVVGLSVISWRLWCWSVYSSYYHMHNTYQSRTLSNQNNLFLRAIYISTVCVAMKVWWMIWYRYSFLLGFKSLFQLYCSWCHNMNIGTIWHWASVSCTPSQSIGLVLWVYVVLVLNVSMCSFYYFCDKALFHLDFHHGSIDYNWDFMAIFSFWTTRSGFL